MGKVGARARLFCFHMFLNFFSFSIEEWRAKLGLDSRPLFFVNAEASLYEALQLLIENKVHRLPLIGTIKICKYMLQVCVDLKLIILLQSCSLIHGKT